MNEKVENLIKQEKERLDAFKKQMRDNHLISLGIIDEGKTERKYLPYNVDGAKLDTETNRYYFEEYFALEVKDEEYEEICKYYSPTSLTPPEKETLKTATAAENTLNTIAVIVLVCGIIGALVCFLVFIDGNEGWIGFIISIGILLTSLITWATLKIVCEIAMNLRQINNKTK